MFERNESAIAATTSSYNNRELTCVLQTSGPQPINGREVTGVPGGRDVKGKLVPGENKERVKEPGNSADNRQGGKHAERKYPLSRSARTVTHKTALEVARSKRTVQPEDGTEGLSEDLQKGPALRSPRFQLLRTS